MNEIDQLRNVDGLPFFLQTEALKPFVNNKLSESTNSYGKRALIPVMDMYPLWQPFSYVTTIAPVPIGVTTITN